ncbi:BTB/POZ and MATH domain-containing protein 2 [Dichanthelium oligosanthes]|uniref:BTB/POZ and MATH domain-containing protein 2 n=1 Tax=Dichanthelium oligosanthes TaxID=888268 RepID=A0A1E5WMI7_9POAL|nr:BTB/POZ and MATH domain-containing protein 2 [Dichanthelium oligosanthes]
MAETASSCTVETPRGAHVLHVHQYSLLRSLGHGFSRVQSGAFAVGGYDWAMWLDASASSFPRHVAVGPVMLTSIGEGYSARAYKNFFGDGFNPLPPAGNYPAVEFFGREEFESPAYLRDDHVAARCEVTVIKDPRVSETRRMPYIEPPLPGRMYKEHGELLGTGDGAGVAFHVGLEVLAAHRAVLAAQSPVFKAELLGPTKENESGLVVVEDMQPAVFKALLGFVYTDAVPPGMSRVEEAVAVCPVMPRCGEALPIGVPAAFDFTLVDDATGWPCPRTLKQYKTFYTGVPHMYARSPLLYFDRKQLESPAFLRDNHLAIRCEVSVINTPRVSETRRLPHVEPPPPTLPRDLGNLLSAGAGTDVTFHVARESFPAHRAVLMARSPVFKARLIGPMEEDESGLLTMSNDDDVQPAVFKALLAFVYTDSLPAMDDLELERDGKLTEMLRRLLVAADLYKMKGLRQLCESVLCNSLDACTVKTTLGRWLWPSSSIGATG